MNPIDPTIFLFFNHQLLLHKGCLGLSLKWVANFVFLLFVIIPLQSQPLVTEDLIGLDQTPAALLTEYLECLDLEIMSVSAKAHVQAMGRFSGGNLAPNLNEGLVLTTGRAKSEGTEFGADALMEEFANVNSFGQVILPNGANTINDGSNVNAMILEFSFIPHFEVMHLDYVFASEEFADYSCARGDDLMGIVISGLGYEYDPIFKGELISVLPDSAKTPITVGNIHPETNFCVAENEDYYIANAPGQQPVYSGMTIPFHQELTLVPGSIYTLQIFIADNSDESKDSGLFLKIDAPTNPFCNIDEIEPTTLVEGCTDLVNFNLSFADFNPNVFPLFWEVVGTAEPNVDYLINNVNGQIVSNTNSIDLTIDVLADGEQEAMEEIILRIRTIDGDELDFVWFIADPLEELSVSREVICGKRKTRVYIEGEQPTPNNYFHQIQQPYELNRPIEAVPLTIQGVPFEYLASSQSIAEVCVDIDLDHSFTLYLVSPDEKRLQLKFVATNTGIENFSACFSTDAIHSIQYDFDNAALGFDVPFLGPYYPFHKWDRLSGAKVNGVWRLEIVHSSNQAAFVTINEFSINFRETGTPDLEFQWEDGAETNEVDIIPFYYTSSGDFLNVDVQVGDCFWQDSIAMNRDSVTEFFLEDTICYNDTINILGEPMFKTKENKVLIFPNAIDCCCDSVLNYSIELIYPSVNFQEVFVTPGEDYTFENALYQEGAHEILSNETNEFGCDSFVYLNVLPVREDFLSIENNQIQDYDTLCTFEDKLGILEDIFPAIFYNYNILIQDTLYGNAREHSNAFGSTQYRCFRMNTFDNNEDEVKRITGQLVDTHLSDTFYFRTKLEFVNVLNQITYPDLEWSYFESNNITCPLEPNISLSNIRSYRYNPVQRDFTINIWTSPISENIDSRLVLPVTEGNNQFIFQTQTGEFIDTVNYMLTYVLPIGQTDSLVVYTEPGQELFYPLTVQSLCGSVETITQVCEDNSTTSIAFNLEEDILQINTFTFGTRSICYELCDSLNICDTLVLTVSAEDPLGIIEEGRKEKIAIFPNPVDHEILFKSDVIDYADIQLVNAKGQLINYFSNFDLQQAIDVRTLPAGIYFLRLSFKEHLIYKKIAVVH